MQTKLTLRVDEKLVRTAKAEARRRGKSVSQMVSDYFGALGDPPGPPALPPITTSLVGLLAGQSASEEDYRRHLRGKHL